jgi:hypothetical protein
MSPDQKIITLRGDCVLTKVADQIDPVTGTWDELLIWDIFHPIDVSRILQIPLTINGFNDFIAWNGTRSGYFSIRLAYHVEWKISLMVSLVDL